MFLNFYNPGASFLINYLESFGSYSHFLHLSLIYCPAMQQPGALSLNRGYRHCTASQKFFISYPLSSGITMVKMQRKLFFLPVILTINNLDTVLVVSNFKINQKVIKDTFWSLKTFFKRSFLEFSPGGQLVGASSCGHTPEGCRFDSQSGHIRKATNLCFSLTSVFLSLPLSL